MKHYCAAVLLCCCAAVLLLGNQSFAETENRKASFKIKSYHLKSIKSHWDKKTAILNLKGHVQIILALADQTTAYMNCDEAEENRLEAKGKCSGNTHFIWQQLLVDSERAFWDIAQRRLEFYTAGQLIHKDFMGGRLDMSFDELQSHMDFDDKLHLIALKAKGIWRPKNR